MKESHEDEKGIYKSTRRRLTRAEWFTLFGIVLFALGLLVRGR